MFTGGNPPTDTATEITNHLSVNSGGGGDACWKKKTHQYSYGNHHLSVNSGGGGGGVGAATQKGWGWCWWRKQ